jgi:hypothetical protein
MVKSYLGYYKEAAELFEISARYFRKRNDEKRSS